MLRHTGHNHTHSLRKHAWLLSCYNCRVVSTETTRPAEQKTVTLWPFTGERSADPRSAMLPTDLRWY